MRTGRPTSAVATPEATKKVERHETLLYKGQEGSIPGDGGPGDDLREDASRASPAFTTGHLLCFGISQIAGESDRRSEKHCITQWGVLALGEGVSVAARSQRGQPGERGEK